MMRDYIVHGRLHGSYGDAIVRLPSTNPIAH